MNLVRISENTLINPDRISFIEMREKKVIVCVDGKIFTIDSKSDLDLLFKELNTFTNNLWGAQNFAG